mmetsp:Transcript_12903/g.27566  ORF Transcript_12903/g.27566 Transcript_12903/m.27566 type:complete len:294 (-) Transcript_12903:134-1015(-)
MDFKFGIDRYCQDIVCARKLRNSSRNKNGHCNRIHHGSVSNWQIVPARQACASRRRSVSLQGWQHGAAGDGGGVHGPLTAMRHRRQGDGHRARLAGALRPQSGLHLRRTGACGAEPAELGRAVQQPQHHRPLVHREALLRRRDRLHHELLRAAELGQRHLAPAPHLGHPELPPRHAGPGRRRALRAQVDRVHPRAGGQEQQRNLNVSQGFWGVFRVAGRAYAAVPRAGRGGPPQARRDTLRQAGAAVPGGRVAAVEARPQPGRAQGDGGDADERGGAGAAGGEVVRAHERAHR